MRFPIDQLVEVAVRALSSGINDPFTAMNCIDRLGSGLIRLAGRQFPSSERTDGSGRLRIVAEPVSFEAVVRTAIEPIQSNALQARSSQVLARLEQALRTAAELTGDPSRRQVLLRYATSAAVAAGEVSAAARRERTPGAGFLLMGESTVQCERWNSFWGVHWTMSVLSCHTFARSLIRSSGLARR